MKEYKNLLTSTTLIPLWAKAVEAQEEDPIIEDKHAYELLKHLGYELDYYDKRKQNPSQVGCCLRAKWIDDETLKFIEQNKPCQVIQLGAGIDDRFRRINMPEGVEYWYDLDLEEVADMRRQVIPEVDRNKIISMDMFDTEWMKQLKSNNLPTLIIIEGVFMYFHEEQVITLLNSIYENLGHATLLFDSVPKKAVGNAKRHDSVRKYNKTVEYNWSIKSEQHFRKIFPEVKSVELTYMSDLPKSYKFMFILRTLYKIPYFRKNYNQLLVKVEI